MNLKALSLGAVAGLFFALVPSCGPAKCGPQNCDGCCDANGACVPKTASNSNTVCGTAGNTCSNCSAMSMVCNPGTFVCEAGATGGGGGSTGGGGGATGGGGGTTGGGGGTTGGGGGSTGGGGGTTACNVATQNCTTGQSCLFTDNQGNTACFAGECDLVTQNCTTTTDACNYAQLADGGVGRACLPAGAGTAGQACSAPNGCAKGLLCLNSVCTKYCYQDSDCGGGGAICATLIQVPGATELPTACVTLTTCDPLLQNCTSGQGCYLTSSGPACVTAGTVANNGTCTPSANCVPGSLCLVTMSGATSGTCKGFCNMDGGMPNCGSAACGPLQGVPYGACP